MSLEILVSGASGTVGQAVIELIESDDRYRIAGLATSQQFFEPDIEADVIIDFSHPNLLKHTLAYAVRRKIPLISGTTGLSDSVLMQLDEAARTIPVCHAANFSIGVNLLIRLSVDAAKALGEDFDIEVLEMHHRRKIDAPSGTALALGHALATARGYSPDDALVFQRTQLRQSREHQEIGMSVLRGGDVVGEHTVFLVGAGERLELTHRATDRRVYANGALQAARHIISRPPGAFDIGTLIFESLN